MDFGDHLRTTRAALRRSGRLHSRRIRSRGRSAVVGRTLFARPLRPTVGSHRGSAPDRATPRSHSGPAKRCQVWARFDNSFRRVDFCVPSPLPTSLELLYGPILVFLQGLV